MGTYESTIIANYSSSIVSTIACSTMIAFYFILKDLKTYSYKLIAIQVSLDLGRCLSNLIPTYELNSSDVLCQAQAFSLQFFTAGSVAWSCVITFSIFSSIVLKLFDIQRFHKRFCIFAMCISLIASVPPLITSDYGRSISWCWIELDEFGFYWILVCTHLVYLVIQIANAVMFYYIIKGIIHTESSFLSNKQKSRVINRTIWYPVILSLCLLPIGAYRIYELFGHKDNYVFINVGMILMNSNGLFNTIRYCSTDTVQHSLKQKFNPKSSLENSFTNIQYGEENEDLLA